MKWNCTWNFCQTEWMLQRLIDIYQLQSLLVTKYCLRYISVPEPPKIINFAKIERAFITFHLESIEFSHFSTHKVSITCPCGHIFNCTWLEKLSKNIFRENKVIWYLYGILSFLIDFACFTSLINFSTSKFFRIWILIFQISDYLAILIQ